VHSSFPTVSDMNVDMYWSVNVTVDMVRYYSTYTWIQSLISLSFVQAQTDNSKRSDIALRKFLQHFATLFFGGGHLWSFIRYMIRSFYKINIKAINHNNLLHEIPWIIDKRQNVYQSSYVSRICIITLCSQLSIRLVATSSRWFSFSLEYQEVLFEES
jgi:hypothetical protein